MICWRMSCGPSSGFAFPILSPAQLPPWHTVSREIDQFYIAEWADRLGLREILDMIQRPVDEPS